MTSGTVEFRQTEYNLNDTLIADFTWTDAKWNFTGENYATVSIYNPSGVLKAQHVEENNAEGSKTLSYTGSNLGQWRARLRIWNGSRWTDLSHYTTIVERVEEEEEEEEEEEDEEEDEEEEEGIGECPDFWVDPVGAVLCWIIRSIEATLGLVSGGFITLLASMQQWSAAFTVEFWNFLQDPISSIQTWMSGVFVTIQDLLGQFSSSISTWWTQTVIDVGVMITNATTGFQSWIDERFTGINDWWADAQTVWGTFWNERIKGVEDFINEFSANVSSWYNSNIQPTIDAISGSIDDAASWISGFPTLLSTWWNDRIIDVGVWIADSTAAANDWITGFPTLIGEWWNDRVVEIGVWLTDRNNEIKKWVEEGLPGWVENMFEWAKPLVSPIIAVAEVLGKLLDITEETIERTPEEQEHIDNRADINNRIKEIVEGR